MSRTGRPFSRISGALLCLAFLASGQATSQCNFPIVRTFGVPDGFNPNPDPIVVLSQFVTYLNSVGIPTASMKKFDDLTPNRQMVASLRHGLRGCFPQATKLTLCFRARAHADLPGNDAVVIYNTNFTNNTFPIIYQSHLVPALTAAWNPGTTATLCIPLTTQMQQGKIGDMLQFRVGDDTGVDFIRMTLQ